MVHKIQSEKQTGKILIRLLLQKQSDKDLHCFSRLLSLKLTHGVCISSVYTCTVKIKSDNTTVYRHLLDHS